MNKKQQRQLMRDVRYHERIGTIKELLPSPMERAAFVSAAFLRSTKIALVYYDAVDGKTKFRRADLPLLDKLSKSDRVRVLFHLWYSNAYSQIYTKAPGDPRCEDSDIMEALSNRYYLAESDYGLYSALKSLFKFSGYRTWPVIIIRNEASVNENLSYAITHGGEIIDTFRDLQREEWTV